MFGTEMKGVTFIIIIIELALLLNIIVLYNKSRNKRLKRFIFFTIYLLIYNISSGLLPDKNIPIPLMVQLIVAYSTGIFVALYYANYLYIEYDIKEYKFLEIKTLTIVLSASFILLFVVPLVFTNDLKLSISLFIYIPIILVSLLIYKVSRSLKEVYFKENKVEKYYKGRIVSVYLALLSIGMMPIVVSLGDFQVIELLTVNLGFFILYFSLLADIMYQERKQQLFLEKMGYSESTENNKNIKILEKFNNYSLTQREIEIANRVLEKQTYKAISQNLYIAEGTVTKHASNIYRKCGASNKKNFILLFSPII